jgi:hypothetical protein
MPIVGEFVETEQPMVEPEMIMDVDPTSGVNTSCNESVFQPCIPADLFEPIYPGSKLTICGAYFSIMHFSHKNKLTYTAIENLLELIALFCPDASKIPPTFYKLRNFFQQFSGVHEKQRFCFECEKLTNNSSCSMPNCLSSLGEGHMVHLSIEKSLQVIITSKHMKLLMHES